MKVTLDGKDYYASGATFKLTVDSTINTSAQSAASIAAYVYGTTTIITANVRLLENF